MRAVVGLAAVLLSAAAIAAGPSVTVLQQRWIDRFERERLVDGAGAEQGGGARVDLTVSEQEFRAIARRHGWRIPSSIKFRFAQAPRGPAITAKAARQVRIFAQSDRSLGLTNQAALGGRIELRNGCFYLVGRGQRDRLAYFPREVGLGTDARGRLTLQSRLTGETLGSIGDEFTWAGPIGMLESFPMVAELRAQCGNAPVEHVGIMTRTSDFRRRFGLPDAPAEPPKPPRSR